MSKGHVDDVRRSDRDGCGGVVIFPFVFQNQINFLLVLLFGGEKR
jgi:hypothetical protein